MNRRTLIQRAAAAIAGLFGAKAVAGSLATPATPQTVASPPCSKSPKPNAYRAPP